MKKAIPLLVAVILWSCSGDNDFSDDTGGVSDFQNISWVRSFGGAGDDTPRSVIQTMDGGYAVLGFTNSTNGDLAIKNTAVNDYWLLKLNADGEVQWQRTYGGSGDDRGQQVMLSAFRLMEAAVIRSLHAQLERQQPQFKRNGSKTVLGKYETAR